MEWSADYVGLPYKKRGRDRDGVDCWGLVRLPPLDLKGVTLPLWDSVDYTLLDGAVEVGRAAEVWSAIAEADAREFDFVRMNAPVERGGQIVYRPIHIGLIAPRGMVLHIQRDQDSILQPIEELRPYITEFVRHRELN